MKYLIATALTVGAAALAAAAEPAAPAKHVGAEALTLCLATTCDGEPVYPTRVFPAGVSTVTVLFHLSEGEQFHTLRASWVAVGSSRAQPSEQPLDVSSVNVDGAGQGTFAWTPARPLAAGRYRLDILADGKPWHSLGFEAVPAAKPAEIRSPANLVPLIEGKSWSYRYVQQSGAGIRITIPGVTPDADGKSRAVMTLTVAEADPQGTRVDSRLNGRLMQQEWWRPTDQGVVVVQRGDGETNVTFDPPQILFPWPLGERSWQWTFAAGGQRFTPTSHLWGPLPMQGPRGPAAGYIVLTEQSRRVPVTDTASRQVKTDTLVEFIPGVGMVRQLFVNTADGEMTNRIEMTMTSEGSTAGGGQRAAKR